MTAAAANPWLSYWDTLPEGRLLFPPECAAFAENFRRELRPGPADKLLDYGCGFGHVAALLAPHVGAVRVWDAAPNMRDAAARLPGVRPWDGTEGDFDFVVVNSVVQYMTADELAARVRDWAAKLKPGGRLVLSDLSEPGHGTLSDLWSLFRFSARRGYLISAVRNTLAERRRYAAAAKARPLYHPARAEVEAFAAAAGLTTHYLPRNLTHFAGRSTAILTKPPSCSPSP